jgi:hypothetical protein
MFEIGQRVRHRKFGTGTLKQLHTQQETPTGLIEWDTHRVSQPWSGFSEAYSWVYLRSLASERPSAVKTRGRP